MNKTQIQVPDELFREIKAFARAREWSVAETFRRGAELLLEVYHDKPTKESANWTAPSSSAVKWKGLSPSQLRELAFNDGDPVLP